MRQECFAIMLLYFSCKPKNSDDSFDLHMGKLSCKINLLKPTDCPTATFHPLTFCILNNELLFLQPHWIILDW